MTTIAEVARSAGVSVSTVSHVVNGTRYVSPDTTKLVSYGLSYSDIAKALPKNRSVSMRVLRQGRASFITFKLAE